MWAHFWVHGTGASSGEHSADGVTEVNAYQKAQQLGITGTDVEIMLALRATGLTTNAIRLDDLLFVLNNRGMLIRLIRPADTGEKWAGTVVNMVLYLNQNGTPEQAAAVNQWFSHITNDRNNLFDTTRPEFAGAFWTLSRNFADLPGMPTSQDFEAVAALGGGWLYSTLTVEEIQSQRAAYEAEQAADAASAAYAAAANAHLNPVLSDSARTVESIAAALLATANAMEA